MLGLKQETMDSCLCGCGGGVLRGEAQAARKTHGEGVFELSFEG